MNILRRFLTKLLSLFLGIIFVISMAVIIERLEKIFNLSGNQWLIFLPVYVIFCGMAGYAIKSRKKYWAVIGSLFMIAILVIPSIIGLYIVFSKYISLPIYLSLVGLSIIFVFVIFYFSYTLPRSRLNNILFKQNNQGLFIEEVEKLIQNSKDKDTKYRWYLEKVRALVMQKKFKESIDILQEVEFDKLENLNQLNYYIFIIECYLNTGNFEEVSNILNNFKTFIPKSKKLQVVHVNSLLYFLTLMERFDEAKEQYNKNSSILYNNSIEVLKTAIKDTIATYKYYCGNIDESKKLFLELDENEQDDNKKESVNYFLGLIFLSEGKEIEAKKRFEKVLEIDKGGYFYNKVIEKQYFKVDDEE